MIYQKKPKIFIPKFEIVSCFVEQNGKILLLHRRSHKPEGDTWGVPAGKVENGEKLLQAISREVKEEIGYQLPESEISYFKKVYVRYPAYDFFYHIFHSKLNNNLEVRINQREHKDFRWTFPQKALKMLLIQDLDSCIKLFYGIK